MERRVKCFKSGVIVLFLFFCFWVVLQFVAPFVVSSGSIPDCSGVVGLVDNERCIAHLGFPWNGVYFMGDVMCHQRLDRSFLLNGNTMPFCSRCTAIWLGVALGLGFTVLYPVGLDEKYLAFLLIGLFPLAIDGFGQLIGFWESSNIVRVITGLLAGGIIGVSFGVIFDELADLRKRWLGRQHQNR